jgi:hypothetical protein
MAAAEAGQVEEGGAADLDALPALALGQADQRAVAVELRQRPGRDSARDDEADVGIAAFRQREQLLLDEDAEIGARRIGEERRQSSTRSMGAGYTRPQVKA